MLYSVRPKASHLRRVAITCPHCSSSQLGELFRSAPVSSDASSICANVPSGQHCRSVVVRSRNCPPALSSFQFHLVIPPKPRSCYLPLLVQSATALDSALKRRRLAVPQLCESCLAPRFFRQASTLLVPRLRATRTRC